MMRFPIVVGLAVCMSSCSPHADEFESARRIVAKEIAPGRDPQFRDLRFVKKTGAVCGQVKYLTDLSNFSPERNFYVVGDKVYLAPLVPKFAAGEKGFVEQSAFIQRDAKHMRNYAGFCFPTDA